MNRYRVIGISSAVVSTFDFDCPYCFAENESDDSYCKNNCRQAKLLTNRNAGTPNGGEQILKRLRFCFTFLLNQFLNQSNKALPIAENSFQSLFHARTNCLVKSPPCMRTPSPALETDTQVSIQKEFPYPRDKIFPVRNPARPFTAFCTLVEVMAKGRERDLFISLMVCTTIFLSRIFQKLIIVIIDKFCS